MVPVSARAELHSCPGARIAGKAALDAGDIDITDVDLLELYSCFPVAIEVFAAELGIAMDRPLTVTGGMRFAGGPFNNYVIQSTCRMAQMLRQLPGSRGLVSSVSGVLTKQGFGLWATEPGPNPFAHIDVSAEVANHQETKRVLLDYTGPGTVAGYTVIHEQMSPPPRGVAIIDVADGARTVAYCDATAVTSRMQEEEFSGRNVHVTEGRFEMV
jgi:acetyl-CoA C-acetyltransferase